MLVGVPREIKSGEKRAGLTPAGVRELVELDHRVLVQNGCGAALGFADRAYREAGAQLMASAEEIYGAAELVVKVKEPQPEECALLREGQLLFAYLHLAADRTLAERMMASGVTGIAYETVTAADGTLPLLAPMSEIAGKVATQAGAHHLEMHAGGRGVLLGGVPGVAPGRVVVIGGGVAGSQAARVAAGMGARVTVLDKSLPRLRLLDSQFNGRVSCEYSTQARLEALVAGADLVIGAVLLAGAAAPKVLSRKQVANMSAGSVLVDIAIDQGGCFATSRPTSHENPTYRESEVIHYCVTNIPSAVARTATLALTHATLPSVLALAQQGTKALSADPHLGAGVNIHRGAVTHPAVAEALGYDCVSWQ